MANRKSIWHDPNRRSMIRNMVGYRSRDGLVIGRRGFELLAGHVHGCRAFMERVYAAILFTNELPLAISIAERTTGIREAGREAKAVAALKLIAGG